MSSSVFLRSTLKTRPPVSSGHPPQLAFSAATAEHEAAAVGAGIAVIDAVDHGVRQLRPRIACSRVLRLPVSTPSVITTMTLRPASLLSRSFGGQVDGILQNRARLVLHGRNRTRMQPADRDAQAQLLQPVFAAAWANWSNPAAARNPCRS